MKKKRIILFWIKSNRGTDSKAVFSIPNDWKKEHIHDALERWCSGFGAWTHGDNIVRYGYKQIKVPPRRELLKAWDKLCAKKFRLDDRWTIMREMFNVRELQ